MPVLGNGVGSIFGISVAMTWPDVGEDKRDEHHGEIFEKPVHEGEWYW
jgi:hypothetical protein